MNQKYKDKYRISSTRLSTWNYNRAVAYFITICTRDEINNRPRKRFGFETPIEILAKKLDNSKTVAFIY